MEGEEKYRGETTNRERERKDEREGGTTDREERGTNGNVGQRDLEGQR